MSLFFQECNAQTFISGVVLKKEVKFFYKKITLKDDFQASEILTSINLV